MRKNYIDVGEFFTAKQLISITGVDRRTAARWIRGKQNMHPGYLMLLSLYIEQRVIPKQARLIANHNYISVAGTDDPRCQIEYGDIGGIFWTKQHLEHLKEENRKLLALNEALQSAAQDAAAMDETTPVYKVTRN